MPEITRIAFPPKCCSPAWENQSSRLDEVTKIEKRAMTMLETHPHFRGRTRWVQCRCDNRRLYLTGKVPSFYLKQLAQEAVRELEDVDLVVNRIEVLCAVGGLAC